MCLRNLRSGVLFFSGERKSVAARESAVGRRKKKKNARDTITARVVCRPLCHACNVSQSDFTGNEYILEGANS